MSFPYSGFPYNFLYAVYRTLVNRKKEGQLGNFGGQNRNLGNQNAEFCVCVCWGEGGGHRKPYIFLYPPEKILERLACIFQILRQLAAFVVKQP